MVYSLNQQIEEADYELDKRAEVYPRQIASGRLRQSIADFHVGRMRAVKRTLEWLRENETDVRAFIAAKAEARKKAETGPSTGAVHNG